MMKTKNYLPNSKQILFQIMDAYVLIIIMQEHGKWKKITEKDYHFLIKEIPTTEFMAYSNNIPNVLNEITNIGFPNLEQINI